MHADAPSIDPLAPLNQARAPRPDAAVAPTEDASRIDAIDVARGFALLGIFMVNIQVFAHPLGSMFSAGAMEGSSALDRVVHFLKHVLCEGRFYPFFSLLFGMGLVLQTGRLAAARGAAWPVYIRRLLVLAVLGLCHGFLLWYGDILFVYSVVGLVLLLCSRARPKVLLGVGLGLLAWAVLVGSVMGLAGFLAAGSREDGRGANPAHVHGADVAGAAQAPGADVPAPVSEAPAHPPGFIDTTPATPDRAEFARWAERGPGNRLIYGLATDQVRDGPQDPAWRALETQALRDGPYMQALLVRALDYLVCLAFAVLSYGWHVAAMFFIGAALMKWRFFDADRAPWQRRFVWLGFGVGLPVSIGLAALHGVASDRVSSLAAGVLTYVPGTLMPLGYLGAVTLIVRGGMLRAVTRPVSCAGRMGLTNYLSETIIATGIFYHWGLGRFGTMGHAAQAGVVLAVYAALVVVSVLWLRVFRFGPMEWLWRTLTYLRWQPMARERAAGGRGP
ncbi:MAG: DUF418 domain-containing protein [Phycisphaerae bacterium]|nr:DUF418 domain-containing protein [Phycisphaerae bacterium]